MARDITVHRIATLCKQGQSPEEIVETYPHLTLGQVYAAVRIITPIARRSNRSWQATTPSTMNPLRDHRPS